MRLRDQRRGSDVRRRDSVGWSAGSLDRRNDPPSVRIRQSRIHRGNRNRNPSSSTQSQSRQDVLRRIGPRRMSVHEDDDPPEGAELAGEDAVPDYRSPRSGEEGPACPRAYGRGRWGQSTTARGSRRFRSRRVISAGPNSNAEPRAKPATASTRNAAGNAGGSA